MQGLKIMDKKPSWPMRSALHYQATWWAILLSMMLILFLIVPPLTWLLKPVAQWCISLGAAWINYWD